MKPSQAKTYEVIVDGTAAWTVRLDIEATSPRAAQRLACEACGSWGKLKPLIGLDGTCEVCPDAVEVVKECA